MCCVLVVRACMRLVGDVAAGVRCRSVLCMMGQGSVHARGRTGCACDQLPLAQVVAGCTHNLCDYVHTYQLTRQAAARPAGRRMAGSCRAPGCCKACSIMPPHHTRGGACGGAARCCGPGSSLAPCKPHMHHMQQPHAPMAVPLRVWHCGAAMMCRPNMCAQWVNNLVSHKPAWTLV